MVRLGEETLRVAGRPPSPDMANRVETPEAAQRRRRGTVTFASANASWPAESLAR